MFRFALAAAALLLTTPAAAQELPNGQSQADYQAWLAAGGPGRMAQVLSFESWQQVTGTLGVLPSYQIMRTASMWRECGGASFEVPPPSHWPEMVKTLRFIRDHVRPALGPVEAVSGYRNPALNACARGSPNSVHQEYAALDLVPLQPISRGQLFRTLCRVHAQHGAGAGAGLGFYSFTRFHVDTRRFRRWGAAGPRGNESPCALIERGEDPEVPAPMMHVVPAPVTTPAAPVSAAPVSAPGAPPR